jgi:hypothetical protein
VPQILVQALARSDIERASFASESLILERGSPRRAGAN